MKLNNVLGKEKADDLLKAVLIFSRTVEQVLEGPVVGDSNPLFSRTRIRVLKLLYRQGVQSATQVSRYLGISKPAVTQIISLLEKAKLIKKDFSEEDRRELTLRLTAKGEETVAKLETKQLHYLRNAVRHFSNGQVREAAEVLDQLTQRLAAAGQAYEAFCLHCGAHANSTCVMVNGKARCPYLEHAHNSGKEFPNHAANSNNKNNNKKSRS